MARKKPAGKKAPARKKAGRKPPALTPKQRCFVNEYLLDLNATQAAIRAGYSAANAGQIGGQLLEKTRIAAAIQAAMDKRSQRVKLSADEVLGELAILGTSDVSQYKMAPEGHLTLVDGAPKDAMRAVSSVKMRTRADETGVTREVEFKLWDKNTALTNAGRHLKLFTDKVQLSASRSFADTLRAARERAAKR